MRVMADMAVLAFAVRDHARIGMARPYGALAADALLAWLN